MLLCVLCSQLFLRHRVLNEEENIYLLFNILVKILNKVKVPIFMGRMLQQKLSVSRIPIGLLGQD